MSVYGDPGSATYAVSINNLSSMLDVLPDNTSNQIQAQNVRDVVAGLWDAIQVLSASLSVVSQVYYTNNSLTTIQVGGVVTGSNFNNVTVQNVFDTMFYPYTPPVITLSSNPNILEFGNTQSVLLNWSIQAGKNNIQSAVVSRPLQFPVAVTTPQSGVLAQGNVSNNNTILNTPTVFTFSVNDSQSIYTSTASVGWRLRRYWGWISHTSSLTNSEIIGLTGAGISSGSELASSISRSYNGINGSGNYLVFAFPSSFGTPSFTVNGLSNTSFTKVNSQTTVTNTFGYTASYDVWRSDTQQNSPISTFQIN